jgi:hypothetical protein
MAGKVLRWSQRRAASAVGELRWGREELDHGSALHYSVEVGQGRAGSW